MRSNIASRKKCSLSTSLNHYTVLGATIREQKVIHMESAEKITGIRLPSVAIAIMIVSKPCRVEKKIEVAEVTVGNGCQGD